MCHSDTSDSVTFVQQTASSMSNDDVQNENSNSLSENWQSGGAGTIKKPLFKPEELDIYTNKLTHEAFIFHAIKINYDQLDHMEYDATDYSMTVCYKDGRTQDLGVKIQWLIRPYIKHANEINIVRTKDQVAVDGIIIPLVHRNVDA